MSDNKNNWNGFVPIDPNDGMDEVISSFGVNDDSAYEGDEYSNEPYNDGDQDGYYEGGEEEYYEDDGYYEGDDGYYSEEPTYEQYPENSYSDDGAQLDNIYEEDSGLAYRDPNYSPIGRPLRRDEMIISGEELEEDEFEDGDIERRDYYPVRFRRDRKFGCLGGFMYAVFVISVSIILACMAWMAASDVLALNKDPITATIEIPKDIFTTKEVDDINEDDEVIGKKEVRSADMDYVATVLKDHGIIEYKFLFDLFAKISNADQKIDPGTYELSTDFDYRALIKKMQAGSESQQRTTIMFPEGYTIYQMFKKLEEKDICSFEDLMKAATDGVYEYQFLQGIEATDYSKLEGYLFPDTYEFYQGMKPSSVVNKMLAVFNYRITAEMYDKAEQMGRSFYEILIIASLIEKESSDAEGEREKIASVIYNRLKRGEVLAIDATSLYSHPDYDGGAPTIEMIEDTSDPYNTRRLGGLPPTPICNPGEAAIKAALNPASTGYYFYALDMETGEHRFFATESEHLAFTATQNYN